MAVSPTRNKMIRKRQCAQCLDVLLYLSSSGICNCWGNCYRNTSAHHFSSAILQHLCDTYRSHHSGQAKLQLVSKQFSIERERRRAGTALTFSFPLAVYQMLGDLRSGNLDPIVGGFTGGVGLGFRAQPLGIMRKSHCRHVPWARKWAQMPMDHLHCPIFPCFRAVRASVSGACLCKQKQPVLWSHSPSSVLCAGPRKAAPCVP